MFHSGPFALHTLPKVFENNYCSVNLYADDTAIYSSSKDPLEVQEVLEAELGAVASRSNKTG